MMKQAVTRMADSLGYAVIPRWRLSRLEMAKKISEVFEHCAIETVIDVGANEGQYRDFLRGEVGFRGSIKSFEPIPHLASQLKARAQADPLWEVRQMALGAAPGHATLNIMAGSDCSSFLQPRRAGNRRQNEKNTVVNTTTVEVSTLDHEFPSLSGLGKIYLKLDTQGFDLEVLRGARRTIADIPAMQSEISFLPFYDGMPTYVESIESFTACGFAVADLFLVTSDDSHRAIEFDCILVRDPLAGGPIATSN